jgi:hypothetical protein
MIVQQGHVSSRLTLEVNRVFKYDSGLFLKLLCHLRIQQRSAARVVVARILDTVRHFLSTMNMTATFVINILRYRDRTKLRSWVKNNEIHFYGSSRTLEVSTMSGRVHWRILLLFQDDFNYQYA